MSECYVCKKQEATTECPQCHNQVCVDCLIDGKCLQCSQEAQSDSIGTTDERMLLPQILPPELRKWNWGAFGCTFIWAAAMKRWGWFGAFFLTILVFHRVYWVPTIYLGLTGPLYWIPAIYLGIDGNRLAWKSRQWDSLQQFSETQRVWAIWGKVLLGIGILFTIIIIIFGYAAIRGGYGAASTICT